MGTAHPRSVALTGSRSAASKRRILIHLLIGIASWTTLAALWFWQLKVYVPTDWLAGVEVIFALLAVWACFSVGWVAWCRSIYRRRHRRTTPLTREVDFAHDAIGRPISASPGIKEERGQLIVSLTDDGLKRYEPAPLSKRRRAIPSDDSVHDTVRGRAKAAV